MTLPFALDCFYFSDDDDDDSGIYVVRCSGCCEYVVVACIYAS